MKLNEVASAGTQVIAVHSQNGDNYVVLIKDDKMHKFFESEFVIIDVARIYDPKAVLARMSETQFKKYSKNFTKE